MTAPYARSSGAVLSGAPTRPRMTIAALSLVVVAILAGAGATRAAPASTAASATGNNGVRLTVDSAVIKDNGKEMFIWVRGSGFSTTANNGFGIYLAFGQKPGQPNKNDAWAQDISRYRNAGDGRGPKWVHVGTPTSPNQGQMNANGTFNIRVAIKSSFTAPNGKRYPRGKPLGIIAFAAHGTETARNSSGQRTGYSQYAFLRLRFN